MRTFLELMCLVFTLAGFVPSALPARDDHDGCGRWTPDGSSAFDAPTANARTVA